MVSPDVGSVKRARKVAEKFGVPIAIIDKRRPKANVMEVMNIIGDVSGKKCLMIDDMIDTAGTICQGAQALKDAGATEIYAACTHAVLSGPAVERLEKSAITKLVMLDTVHLPEEKCGISSVFLRRQTSLPRQSRTCISISPCPSCTTENRHTHEKPPPREPAAVSAVKRAACRQLRQNAAVKLSRSSF